MGDVGVMGERGGVIVALEAMIRCPEPFVAEEFQMFLRR